MTDLRAHQRAYFAGGENAQQIKVRARRLLVTLVDNFPAYVQRRGLQTVTFEGEHYWPGDTISALEWLELEGYAERNPEGGKRWRGWWKATEQGVNAVASLPEPWGGGAA